MRVKMLVSMAGLDFALSPGEETGRFTDGEAVRLIEAGYAVPVSTVKVETASAAPAREKRKK